MIKIDAELITHNDLIEVTLQYNNSESNTHTQLYCNVNKTTTSFCLLIIVNTDITEYSLFNCHDCTIAAR